MSDADGTPVPDFFDRLIARHAAPVAGPRPDVARVRPRLPGPFERVEAVRAAANDPDDTYGADPLWPAATPAAAAHPDRPRPAETGPRPAPERERTVVHTERVHDGRPTAPAPRPAGPKGRCCARSRP